MGRTARNLKMPEGVALSGIVSFKYRAFLSYSHIDTSWAKWLHSRLEGFGIDKDLVGRETAMGPVPKTLWPIFRDREDFAGGYTLTDATIAALDASAALIVLCSPVSGKSLYVNEEVRLFKSRHPERPVVPVIIAGDPPENFPAALRHEVLADGTVTDHPVTILAPDVRESGDGKRLALAKVIAGITGVATDEIARRAERAARAAIWRRRGAYAAVMLLLGSIGLAWWNQDFFKEQYQWRWVMIPSVLSAETEKERAAKPRSNFKECANGCPMMIVVPAGDFMMGSREGEGYEDEHPQHKIAIAKPFAVGKFAVTFAEWDACTAAGGCPKASDSGWSRDDRPVIHVSWNDAKLYVEWLSRMTGKQYRLLTEAEWEYAARARTTTKYWWGGEPKRDGEVMANCRDCGSDWGGKQTAPVGKFPANPFGLYDMLGNVFQWVEDCYVASYQEAPADGSAQMSGHCSYRVLRGGSWGFDRNSLRSANRYKDTSGGRGIDFGFRVGRELTP